MYECIDITHSRQIASLVCPANRWVYRAFNVAKILTLTTQICIVCKVDTARDISNLIKLQISFYLERQ